MCFTTFSFQWNKEVLDLKWKTQDVCSILVATRQVLVGRGEGGVKTWTYPGIEAEGRTTDRSPDTGWRTTRRGTWF